MASTQLWVADKVSPQGWGLEAHMGGLDMEEGRGWAPDEAMEGTCLLQASHLSRRRDVDSSDLGAKGLMGGAQGPGAWHQRKRVMPASGGTEVRSEEPQSGWLQEWLPWWEPPRASLGWAVADSGQGKDSGKVIARCSPA